MKSSQSEPNVDSLAESDAGQSAPVERKSVAFEVKAVSAEGSGGFEGLAAVFHNIDEVGDIIAPGAFAKDLPDFLANGFVGNVNHDWDCPIGHPASAAETADGLYLKAVLDGSPDAQSVRLKMTPHASTGRATIRKLSIGYKSESKPLPNASAVKAYWEQYGYTPTAQDLARAERGVRLLTRIKLIEVSPVAVPANSEARITDVKGLESKSFDGNSLLVASALGEALEGMAAFVARAESRFEARFKVGRELSRSNWDSLKELCDQHGSMCESHTALHGRLKALLDRTAPKSPEECEPEDDAEPAPKAVPSVPAIDEAAINEMFANVMYATNPAL